MPRPLSPFAAALADLKDALAALHLRTSVPADLVLAGPGLEDAFLERAVIHDLGGVRVPVARAEDVIVMKVLAGRDKDLDDVVAILEARGTALNADEVRSTLAMVENALGQSDLLPAWERLYADVAKPGHKKKPANQKKSEVRRASARSSLTRPRKRRAP